MFNKYWAKILGPNFQKFSCENWKLMFPILDIFILFYYLLPWCIISTINTIKTLHKTVQNEEKRKKYSVSNFFTAIITSWWFPEMHRNGSPIFVKNRLLLSKKVAKILVILVFTALSCVGLFTFCLKISFIEGDFVNERPLCK